VRKIDEPPSCGSNLVIIGRNSRGDWVAREHHGLFGGLFVNRAQAMKYALFENGEHGQLAAPIVRDVLKAYFDKKARLAQPQPQIAHIPTGLLQPPPPVPATTASVNP